jgi:hypothetical protein
MLYDTVRATYTIVQVLALSRQSTRQLELTLPVKAICVPWVMARSIVRKSDGV